jgi:hypothetical protein
MTKRNEIRCCESCGRDCLGQFCQRCIGHVTAHTTGGHRGEPFDAGEAEDRYDEESGPDSVYRGQHDNDKERI